MTWSRGHNLLRHCFLLKIACTEKGILFLFLILSLLLDRYMVAADSLSDRSLLQVEKLKVGIKIKVVRI